MSQYPQIIIDQSKILYNAAALKEIGEKQGIYIMPVVKGLAGDTDMIKKIVNLGFKSIANANLERMRFYKDMPCAKWFIRCPAISEIPELVDVADGCFITESETLKALELECKAKSKGPMQVLLVAELGDRREGCLEKELIELAKMAETMPHLHLKGIAANLSCLNNVVPDVKNMSQLVNIFHHVENTIGRPLETLSGGNSSSVDMMIKGKLPKEVTELRLGESLLLGMLPCWDKPIGRLKQHSIILKAEIAELKTKPSKPEGTVIGVDSFGGGQRIVRNKGDRKRAIVIGGKQSMYVNGIKPVDPQAEMIGDTSDYLIVDVTDCDAHYKVGDIMTFYMDYGAMATGLTTIPSIIS